MTQTIYCREFGLIALDHMSRLAIRENKIVKKLKLRHSRNLGTSKITNYTVPRFTYVIKIAVSKNLILKISWGSWGHAPRPLAFSMLYIMPIAKPSPHSLLLYATVLQNSLNRNSIPSYKFTIRAPIIV